MWSDEIDPIQLAELVEAYTVRQVWLGEVQAAMMVKALATALGSNEGRTRRVDAAEMMNMLGVQIVS